MSVYAVPGRYKLETLVMYLALESLTSSDANVGPSVLLGLATRIAIHSGYHRDLKHYPEISVFDGEMRRRVWLYLSLLDHYVSLQAGLPPTMAQVKYDTEEPRNLMDEDFDQSTKVLPPSRSLMEKTPVLFAVALHKILLAGAQIIDRVYSVKGVSYSEEFRFDKELRELHASLPPLLRMRPLRESIADPPSTILDRYKVDLLYQKARCDLHRRYLTQHRLDPTYAYSRQECLDAARQVLKHQSEILQENHPGGQLSYASFFFSHLLSRCISDWLQ